MNEPIDDDNFFPNTSPLDQYVQPGKVRYAPSVVRAQLQRGRTSPEQEVVVMLLAGGQGERLYPLTKDRAKPAVPFGGVYRIIDFTLSNCLNSGLRRIFVLTQYKSFSLQRHIQEAWNLFNPLLGEFMDVVPPQQRNVKRWYQGTADAVFQNIYALEQERPRWVLLVSGDHIYKMDYSKMLDFHLRNDADVTVSCTQVPLAEASRFGIVHAATDGSIQSFAEKPIDPTPIPGDPDHCFASMGVYLFSTDILVQSVIDDVKKDTEHDFGKNIIPQLIKNGSRVFAYQFEDENPHDGIYWRDIGTLESYYEANMDLVRATPQFSLYDDHWPVRRRSQPGPPGKTVTYSEDRRADLHDSMLSTGTIVSGSHVDHSILGPRCFIHSWADVRDSILFDDVEIGRHCKIRRAIIDKHVKIPPHTEIGYDAEADKARFTCTEKGIVVIPKGMIF